MILRHWLVEPNVAFRQGDAICELEIDGATETVTSSLEDVCGFYWFFVDDGEEVGLDGVVGEYTDTFGGPLPTTHPRVRRRDRPLPPPRDAYPRIFLSYRRDDSEAYAGRLYETLAREFGADGVFIDLFGIRPGEFYPWTIQQAAAHAAVFVTLIGPKWLQLADSSGRRRLDVPEDYVRREITTALDRGTPIIPLLLPGVDFIDPTLLPDEMLGLERRQALQLIPRHWNADIGEVIAEIRRRLG